MLYEVITIEMDVVDRGQNRREDLVGVVEMVQVDPGEILAAVAAAGGVHRVEIPAIAAMGEADLAAAGKEGGSYNFV